MKELYRVEVVSKGYVVWIGFQEADSAEEAIQQARPYIIGKGQVTATPVAELED